MELNPIPTISPPESYLSCILPTVAVRKPSKERVYQDDELRKVKSNCSIQSFSDVSSSLLDFLGEMP